MSEAAEPSWRRVQLALERAAPHLDYISLRRLGHVNRRLRLVLQSNHLWYDAVRANFQDAKAGILQSVRYGVLSPAQINWKAYFLERIVLDSHPLPFRWKQLPKPLEVEPRYAHTAVFCRGRLIVAGGERSLTCRYDDVASAPCKDLIEGSRTQSISRGSAPVRLSRHAAETLPGGRSVVLIGGHDGQSHFHEISVMETESLQWRSMKTLGDIPPSRSNHAIARLGNWLYLFGGNGVVGGQQVSLGDFYRMHLKSKRWENMSKRAKGQGPGPRSGHRMVAIAQRLWVFGGGVWSDSWISKYNEAYVFNVCSITWRRVATPPFVDASTFPCVIAAGNQLLIWGGQELGSCFTANKLYTLDTITLAWRSYPDDLNAPTERDMATLTAVSGSKAVLLGGNHAGATNDCYVLESRIKLSARHK